ncbi:MAG: glutamate--tRNA ligase [Pseudomonadales bacterium]|nr:glutamate--tRNA ligase [Candidatus Woesebacteria bacterium]MCB9800836.1 glutamate--tRNA ligase [Pseudomonadales bacterium]
MKNTVVRTRMAPSPTGDIHVGSMATLLKNYAFAKKHGGSFVLRIEDTDKEREVEGAIQRIQDIIHDYGLDWDEGPDKGGEFGPYIQSERMEIYSQMAKKLVDEDKAYYCTCSRERLEEVRDAQRAAKVPPKYDKFCRNRQSEVKKEIESGSEYVIRLKTPESEDVTFTDLIRGNITFNSDSVDDQVLLKSDGFPTYHLAVVVDDHFMHISHIMRGEEWISSTPKHVLLYQAFGWEMPVFAHIPVYLNPDGKGKMSKRKGTVSAQSFLDKGYLPEALLNFFMILGWAHPEEKEILTLDEYIEHFDPKDVSSKSVVFDLKKLDWINGMYIRKLNVTELEKKLKPFIPESFPSELVTPVLPLIHERLEKLSDFEELTSFFVGSVVIPSDLLLKKSSSEEVTTQLAKTHEALSTLPHWTPTAIESTIRELQEKHDWKRNQYFMMLRIAATGKKATPPLFETMHLIGKPAILERLQTAKTLV